MEKSIIQQIKIMNLLISSAVVSLSAMSISFKALALPIPPTNPNLMADISGVVVPKARVKKNKNLEHQVPKGMFLKEKTPFTVLELANIAYAKCLQLIKEGNDVKAAQGLQKIVDRIPNYTPARLKLLEIYRNIGWDSEALNLLNDGLRLDNTNSKFIMHKAAILLEKNQAEKSLSLLLKIPGKDKNNTEYKSLLAMAYLQLKLYDLASKNYGYLIRQDIKNSNWWLGMAISLEAQGDAKGAIKGFERVKNLGGVNNEVIEFVNLRLANLAKLTSSKGRSNNKK